MTYSMYDTFTIEEADSIGSKFRAICKATHGYEGHLTSGKEYEIEIAPRILELSPLCKLVGDKGRVVECHLTRFEKV